ncbi:MAG: DUF3530 family protein [Thiotrichaceae bacterium]|nr:DUF3530 family protein [Thiotrichaceae bacterium]
MFFSFPGYFFALFALLLNFSLSVQAANEESEKRWAAQLRDNIVIGEPIDLADGPTTFFSIYSSHTTAQPKGVVILLHGTGAHPDWGDVIHPLRTELPDKGWATLSIQLPLLPIENEADMKQDFAIKKQVIDASISRINAAIKFLQEKEYTKITLIAHSFGALMALNYCQSDATSPPIISTAIVIGTPSYTKTIPLNSPMMIEKINIPLLDLYGSEDLDNVLQSAKARKYAAIKAGNKRYRQAEIIGANHFYTGLDDELVTYVSGWLNKNSL